MTKICKDCEPSSKRPAPYPGPRCASHHRVEKKRVKTNNHARRIEQTYKITIEEYNKVYEAQGGKCFICQVATGKTKMLAVEHEHGLCNDHPPDQGCRKCIRCLACGRCNKLIAFLGVEALQRAIQVLTDPPARRILNESPRKWVDYDDGHYGGYPHWCTQPQLWRGSK